MSDLLPVHVQPPLPPDSGYHVYGPGADYGAPPLPSGRTQRYLLFLKKLWWVPVLTLILCLGGAGAVVYYLPPTYTSRARMWETEKLNLPGGASFISDVQTYLGTQMELLRSGRLQRMASDQVQSNWGTNKFIPNDKDGNPARVDLKLAQAPRSSVFYVEASSPYREYTHDFLAAIMLRYVDYKKDVRKSTSSGTLDQVKEQITRFEGELEASRTALSNFQTNHNVAVLTQEAGTAGAHLTMLEGELSSLRLQKKLLEDTALEQDKSATNSGAFLADSLLPGGSSSGSALAVTERQIAFKELQVLQIKRDKLSKYLRPKHPKIVQLDAQIDQGQKLVNIYRQQSHDQLEVARKGLEMKITSTEGSIQEWQAKVAEFTSVLAEARRLEGEVARSQSLYDQLQRMQQNVQIGGIDQESLAVLDFATPASRTYRREETVLALGAFLGVALGLGIVFLIEMRDDRFTSVTEVNEKITDNIFGQVPEVLGSGPRKPLPLLEDNDERHMFAESYRNLRSALLFLPFEGQKPKVILVTSALPNEGKSTISANLARALAMGGSRVLLVDADLRKGALHEMLGLQREPGLAELLRKPDTFDQVVQRNGRSNLAFLARGRPASNPGDLFLGPALNQLLARWRDEFDCVIIDSCPVFAADDATTLAPRVDGTLFVVRNRFSRNRSTREALDMLAQRQARVLGLIFNRTDASAKSYYYYKYSEYAGHNANDGTT
jgi:capsular exopolysaccharide synthesis family protein